MKTRTRILATLALATWVTALVICLSLNALVVAIVLTAMPVIVITIRSFGIRTGLWFTAIGMIPLREPFSIDIVGTASVFPTDLLVVALAAELLYTKGLLSTWRTSLQFKLGMLLLALSLPGLYTATNVFWGIAALYQIVMQICLFFVTYNLIVEVRDGRRALLAIALWMIPALIYGVYQSLLPFDAALPDWANRNLTYSGTGDRSLRIFSTFDHTLHFSQYCSVGLAIAIGIWSTVRSHLLRAVLVMLIVGFVYCNLHTYSVGGILGMAMAVSSFVFLRHRAAALLTLPAMLLVILIIAPADLALKAQRIGTGKAATGAARMITYEQAFRVMMDHPLTGLGWGGIRSALENEYRVVRAVQVAFTAENYFLQHGVGLGIPGLLTSLGICFVFLAQSRKLLKTGGAAIPSAAIVTAGITFYFQGQFIPATEVTSLLLWILLAVCERTTQLAAEGS